MKRSPAVAVSHVNESSESPEEQMGWQSRPIISFIIKKCLPGMSDWIGMSGGEDFPQAIDVAVVSRVMEAGSTVQWIELENLIEEIKINFFNFWVSDGEEKERLPTLAPASRSFFTQDNFPCIAASINGVYSEIPAQKYSQRRSICFQRRLDYLLAPVHWVRMNRSIQDERENLLPVKKNQYFLRQKPQIKKYEFEQVPRSAH